MTREETLKHFKTWCQQTLGNNCSDKDLHMANNIIALLEQEQQPKMGKWLCSDDMFEYAVCSLCKENVYEPFDYANKHFKYCPMCGAKMREVEE